MQIQTFIKIQNNEIDSHFFVYKDKKYPIKFSFFKNYSEYFSYNKKELKKTKMIPIIEKSEESIIDIPDFVVQQFIDFVQCQTIPLNNDNIIFLYFLGKKYKVSSLIKAIDEFLNNHRNQLALQLLLTHQNHPQFDTSSCEDAISKHFDRYIKDRRLFQLEFSKLYRIFHKYLTEIKQSNSKIKENEVINFLFECLDKYGRDASILFNEVEFNDTKFEILNRLVSEYSEIFDFNFINTLIVRSLHEIKNDFLKNQINEMKLMKEENDKMKFKFQQKQEDERRNLENMRLMREEINKMKLEFQQKEERNINLMREEINKMKLEFQQKEEENMRFMREEMNKLIVMLKHKEEENSALMQKENDKMKLEFQPKEHTESSPDYNLYLKQYNFLPELDVKAVIFFNKVTIEFTLPSNRISDKIKTDLLKQDFKKGDNSFVALKKKTNSTFEIKGSRSFEVKVKSLLFILKNYLVDDHPIFEAEYIPINLLRTA